MKELIMITGSSSGIGLAAARRFSKEGHPLLLISRRGDLAQDQLPQSLYARVDVTDRPRLKAVVAEAERQFGPVECLVNNAGVMMLGSLATQEPSEWDQMIEVNIKGVLNGIHAVLGGMRQRRQGTIIQIGSVAGRKIVPNHAIYCATKFAVHALSEALRMEVAGEGVRVVTVAPGIVETELLGHTTDPKMRAAFELLKRQIGKTLETDEIAELIYYAYAAPAHVCLREIVVGPTGQVP